MSARGAASAIGTSAGATHAYRHNPRGERVSKQPLAGGSATYFVYNEAGQLLGEYTAAGAALKEYVWLDDALVAILGPHAGTDHQYVLTDHLGTPRAVARPDTHAIVWRWNLSTTAFGDHAPLGNPDGDAHTYTLNLRYPGQYFDAESGLHYNYFRDYDPGTGRYVQSDPIGLAGGLSTYSYVRSSPLLGIDPLGLLDVQAQYVISQGEGTFRYRFTFQTGYWSDVAIDRIGRVTRGTAPNVLSATQGLAERSDGRPVGMSDIPFHWKKGLKLCADIDVELSKIFDDLFPGQEGEWISESQAQQALSAFGKHLNGRVRNCGMDASCQDPFKRVLKFYMFHTMLQRSQDRMDSYSRAVYARNNRP